MTPYQLMRQAGPVKLSVVDEAHIRKWVSAVGIANGIMGGHPLALVSATLTDYVNQAIAGRPVQIVTLPGQKIMVRIFCTAEEADKAGYSGRNLVVDGYIAETQTAAGGDGIVLHGKCPPEDMAAELEAIPKALVGATVGIAGSAITIPGVERVDITKTGMRRQCTPVGSGSKYTTPLTEDEVLQIVGRAAHATERGCVVVPGATSTGAHDS